MTAMTDEIWNLKAVPAQGSVKLTWGVTSTNYLVGFDVIVTLDGQVFQRINNLPPTAREYTVTGLDPSGKTRYGFNVRADVEQGGRTVEATPLTPPPPVEGKPVIGLNGTSGWGSPATKQIIAETGVAAQRYGITFENFTAEAEAVKAAVDEGCKPYLVYLRPHAERTPAVIAADMADLVALIRQCGLPLWLEERNEPYYEEGLTVQVCAEQFKQARQALANSGVILVAKAWGDYFTGSAWSQQEAGNGWCVDFCKALGSTPAAWAVHAYGPPAATHPFGGGNPCGWDSIPPLVAFLKEHGIDAPLWVTEIGQRTSAGSDGAATCDEAEQAEIYSTYVEQTAAWGLAGLFIYEAVDTGEGGYGVFEWPLKAKPSAAAIKAAVAELTVRAIAPPAA
jgi:hypothetical protein